MAVERKLRELNSTGVDQVDDSGLAFLPVDLESVSTLSPVRSFLGARLPSNVACPP